MKYLPPGIGRKLTTTLQMLGCAALLAPVSLPAPAMAQADGARTCRSALGEEFAPIAAPHRQRCCFVAEELAWYKQKGVVLGKVYLTADQRKVRPRLCSNADATAPAEPPRSLMTGNGDSPRRTIKDYYYDY